MWKPFASAIAAAILLLPSPVITQTTWTKYPGNPVMSRGPSGAWDDFVVIPNRIIRVQDTLRMWYSGSRTGITFEIGYAWSTNGGITWTKHPSNPILTPTQSWEGSGGNWPSVNWPYVIYNNQRWEMWYLGGGGLDIGYATSPDGIQWTKDASNPVLGNGPAGSWDQYSVGWPCVLGPDGVGRFKMWFEGWNSGVGTSQVGYATATNESTWARDDLVNPVLKPVPNTWEPSNLRGPRVMSYGPILQMWYSGGAGVRSSGVGYATSGDGITWVKEARNPVLAPGLPGSWDASNVTLGDIILVDTIYHMWYAGSAGSFAEVGYATAPLITGAVQEVSAGFPTSFALEQNYPNPFNPSTTIRYQLPRTSEVRLSVYDMLGREVSRLLDTRVEAGVHEATFYATGLSSGVYFYTLRTGGYAATKKLLLLR